MKDINLRVNLPSKNKLKSDLDTLVGQVSNDSELKLKLNANQSDLKGLLADVGKLQQAIKNMGDVKILSQGNNKIDGNIISEFVKLEDKLGNIISLTEKQGKIYEGTVVPIEKMTQAEKKYEEAIYKSNDALDVKKMKLQETLSGLYSRGNIAESGLNSTGLESMISNLNLGSGSADFEKINQLLREQLLIEKDIIATKKQEQSETARSINEQLKLKDSVEATKTKYQAQLEVIQKQNQAFLNSSKGSGLKTQLEGISKELNNLNPKSMNDLNTYTSKLDATLKTTKADITSMGKEWSNSTKSVNTFGGAISEATKKIGIFSLGYMAISKIRTSISDGIEAVKDMDKAMTTLKITMNGMSDTALKNVGKQAQELATSLSSTTSKVLEAVTTFANAGETVNSIMNKTGSAIILSNLTGLDTSTTVDTIQSATQQFEELSDGSEKSAMKVTDSMTAISKALGVDFSKGISEMSESLNILGNLSSQLGGDLDDTLALISTGMEKMRVSGSEMATSLKTIMVRTMRISGEGVTEDQFKNAEKALSDVGIKIRDLNTGEMQPFMVTLKQIAEKWDTMSQAGQMALGEQLGGVRQLSQVLGTIKNFDRIEELANIGKNSDGSGLEAQAIWAESLDAKLQNLANSSQIFWQNFFNSDMLKGGIDGLSNIISLLDETQNKFGTMATTTGLLSTVFLSFTNNPLRGLSEGMIKGGKSTTEFQKIFSATLESVKNTNGVATKTKVGVQGLGVAFNTAGVQAAITTTKVALLQMTLSLGLGLAITAVVAGITKLGDALFSTGKTMDDCSESAKVLSTSLNEIKSGEDLVSQYEKLNNKLKDVNMTAEEREGIESEIESVRKQLATDDAFYWVLNDEKESLESQLALMKEIQKQRLLENAEELDKDMPSQRKMGNTSDQLSLDVSQWKELDEAIKNADASGMAMYKGHSVEAKNLMSIQDEVKDRINKGSLEIKNYNGQLKVMGDVGYETSRSEVKLSDSVETTLGVIKKETEALEENTKSKEDNSNTVSGSEYTPISVEDATKSYVEAAQKATELQNIIEAINKEQAMTPDIMGKLSEYYGDLKGKITDVDAVQSLLNDKIQEQVDIQAQAYEIMIGDDEEYYAIRLQNASELQSYFDDFASMFVDVNSSSYNFDIGKIFCHFIQKCIKKTILIAGNSLEFIKLQHKDEINLNVNV